MAAEAWLPLGGHESREQRGDADDDEHVGEVERGPEAKVEEVRHVPEPNPIREIGEAAADQEPERDGKYRMARA